MDLETAWAAGLLEGEACFGLYRNGSRSRLKELRCRPNVVLAMLDRDVVERVHAWAGVGNVGRRAADTVTGNPVWVWNVTRRPHVRQVLLAVLPYLCARRFERAVQILDYMHDTDELTDIWRSRFQTNLLVNRGEWNGNATLTWERVRQMRERYAEGGITQRRLAYEYGIGFSQANRIVRNLNWKEVA